jgi:hypothetical protein
MFVLVQKILNIYHSRYTLMKILCTKSENSDTFWDSYLPCISTGPLQQVVLGGSKLVTNPFPQPQLEGDAVLNMSLIILQHNLGVIYGKCSYTDYPDCSLNFFLQDLRSVAVQENIEELHVRRVVGSIAHCMAKYYAKLNGLTTQAPKPNKNCTVFTKSFCVFLNNGCRNLFKITYTKFRYPRDYNGPQRTVTKGILLKQEPNCAKCVMCALPF